MQISAQNNSCELSKGSSTSLECHQPGGFRAKLPIQKFHFHTHCTTLVFIYSTFSAMISSAIILYILSQRHNFINQEDTGVSVRLRGVTFPSTTKREKKWFHGTVEEPPRTLAALFSWLAQFSKWRQMFFRALHSHSRACCIMPENSAARFAPKGNV